ncbi:MAG: hypothetical protein FWD17_08745, partial [Polyangiaceae bacterium]|nr:hypothetical protein [Polyangiaceae bacterium]
MKTKLAWVVALGIPGVLSTGCQSGNNTKASGGGQTQLGPDGGSSTAPSGGTTAGGGTMPGSGTMPGAGAPPVPTCGASQCDIACAAPTDCPASFVCTNSVCTPTLPSSTSYVPCQLDVDCPKGDHCTLGVCAYDCTTGSDCMSGLQCDSRGRCSASANVDPPVVTTSVGAPRITSALTASAAHVDLGLSDQSSTVTVSAAGPTPIAFQALSSAPWLTVSPPRGTLPAASGGMSQQPLTLNVNRAMAASMSTGAKTQSASVRVNSTAGTVIFVVQVASDLSGHWAGNVDLDVGAKSDGTGGYPVAHSSLQMDIAVDATGQVTGFIEPQNSLLFPYQSAVTGTLNGSQLTLNFTLPATDGTTNPAGTLPALRKVTLTGTVSGSNAVTGTYLEEGDSPGVPSYYVGGSFTLQWTGAANAGQAAPAAMGPAAAPASPFSGTAYDVCRNETGGTADPAARGVQDLQLASTFYSTLAQAYNNWSTQGDPYVAVIDNACGGSCIDYVELRCAEYWFEQAIALGGTEATTGQQGLLDAWQVAADYALLLGADRMVTASTAWTNGTAQLDATQLSNTSSWLSSPGTAQAYFQNGSHTLDQTQPLAMLDPFFAAQILDPSFASLLDAGSTGAIQNSGAGSGTHFRSQLGAIGGQIQAADTLSDWEFRLGDASDIQAATSTISLAAIQGYLDLAWMGVLLTEASESSNVSTQLATISSTYQSLNKRLNAINGGLNPAGYAPDYVFFQ